MPDQLQEVRRFEEELEKCTRCGFCTYWCPVYQEERVESAVARGKNMMIRGLASGELKPTHQLLSRLAKCTLCMSCTLNCPVSVHSPDAIVAARASLVESTGLSLLNRLIYRQLLPRRQLFGSVVRFASWMQHLLLPHSEGTTRHLPSFLSALGKGRNLPQIAPRFLRQILPVVNKPQGKTAIKVGYFIGCMTDFVFSEAGKKLVHFLTRHGVEVIIPKEQGCCGAAVFLGAGDFKTGRKLADKNVEAFKGLDYIISSCATCTSALKDYPKFLADSKERRENYSSFASKVKDISEFLVDILKLPKSAYQVSPELEGKKVTWHDPCHLNRHLGIRNEPREIIKAISGLEYVEMPEADRCCGMAGTFSIYYYELSKKIADKKVELIRQTGADIVVTGCPGCQIQLVDAAIRNGMRVKVMHLIELLA